MDSVEFSTGVAVPAAALREWHVRPGAFERLVPPWDGTRVTSRSGSIEDDTMRVELSVQLPGGIRQRWRLHHEGFDPSDGFDDVLDTGPFRVWRHHHRFEPDGAASSRLRDTISYELPRPLGMVGAAVARRHLERMFAYRHRVTRDDLAAHARAALPPLRVAITGATGMIGRALAAYLSTAGHTVVPISRRPIDRVVDGDPLASTDAVVWDPATGSLDVAALEGVDAVVHLAGEPIAPDRWVPPARWTPERRRRILASRVDGTRLLASALGALEQPPRVLVCASAIGYYGDRGEAELGELDAPGNGFLAEVATAWEAAAQPARDAGIRTVHARIGVVLDPRGGALRRMLLPARLGAGGPLGSGRQWWSWIALDDVVSAIEHAIARDDIEGPMNVVAPTPLRQRELARVLGRVLRRPAIAPAPAAALHALLGRRIAGELLLASTRVAPRELARTGYEFRHADAESLLRHVLGRDART